LLQQKSRYLVIKLTKLETLYLRIWVLTVWVLFQRLEVANKIALPNLLQKVEVLLLLSTLNSN